MWVNNEDMLWSLAKETTRQHERAEKECVEKAWSGLDTNRKPSDYQKDWSTEDWYTWGYYNGFLEALDGVLLMLDDFLTIARIDERKEKQKEEKEDGKIYSQGRTHRVCQ